MGSMAPDWRAIGSPPAQAAQGAGTGRAAISARHLAWGAGGTVAALVLGAVVAFLALPTTGGVVIDAGSVTGAADMPSGDGEVVAADLGPAVAVEDRLLVVDVEGAIARPGLVHVAAGGRVGDAIELAGGFAANADLAAAAEALNLAQEVSDGLKVVVPAMGDGPAQGSGDAPGDSATGGPIDLNHATEAELDGLPGVGPATIAKIVAARQEAPFRTVDELRSRGVVGEATFGKLRDLVAVGR
jgi:competence protein ComEA